MTDRLPTKTLRWRTLAGVGAILAPFAATVVAGCAKPPRTEPAPPTIVLENVTLRHYGKDGTLRIGKADEVSFRRDKGQLEATKIAVDVPPDARMARGGSHLEAGSGEADLKGHEARLAGGVHLTTGLGDDGRTESARWDQASDTIVGEKPVQVAGPGYGVEASGFSFLVGEQKLDLAGNVKILSEPEVARAAR